MEVFLSPLRKWGLHWLTFYQDLDPKKANDNAYRHAEQTSPHVASLRALLNDHVLPLANDPQAGWALRNRLKRNAGDIEHKFKIRASGTKFSLWFIPLFVITTYLLFGMEAVGFLLPEWAAVARNLPTDIRTVFIYSALFMFWAITAELVIRILEDRLLSALISTTAYLLVILVPGWRPLYNEAWFIWTIVGSTGVFVTIVSSRRAALNTVEAFFIRRRRFNAAFVERVRQVFDQLQEPTNQLLDMIDDHEEVASTWEMIFGVSKLSSNLQMQNSFLKADIGDMLKALECCLPTIESLASIARRCYPKRWTWVGMILVWLFGEGNQTYPIAPKLVMAFLTLIIMAFAVIPFKDFPFVIGTAVVWGWRCFLRILFPALSPFQSVRDVLKIFGSIVSSGLLDAPYSLALLATKFKVFNNRLAFIFLTSLECVLVETVSDAIGPLALYWVERWGWVAKPVRRRRCGAGQPGQNLLSGIELTA